MNFFGAEPYVIFGVIGAVLGGMATVLSSITNRYESKRRETRVIEIQLAEREVADSTEEEDLKLAKLWAVTQKRIDFYHDIAIKQSKRSFIGAQVAMYVGFFALLALGGIAVTAQNPTAAITAGGLGVASTALSGFVAATFIKAHSEASAQLRDFFLQPVEFSRMLGVERLVESLDANHRSEAVQQIIRSMMHGKPLAKAEDKKASN